MTMPMAMTLMTRGMMMRVGGSGDAASAGFPQSAAPTRDTLIATPPAPMIVGPAALSPIPLEQPQEPEPGLPATAFQQGTRGCLLT